MTKRAISFVRRNGVYIFAVVSLVFMFSVALAQGEEGVWREQGVYYQIDSNGTTWFSLDKKSWATENEDKGYTKEKRNIRPRMTIRDMIIKRRKVYNKIETRMKLTNIQKEDNSYYQKDSAGKEWSSVDGKNWNADEKKWEALEINANRFKWWFYTYLRIDME